VSDVQEYAYFTDNERTILTAPDSGYPLLLPSGTCGLHGRSAAVVACRPVAAPRRFASVRGGARVLAAACSAWLWRRLQCGKAGRVI